MSIAETQLRPDPGPMAKTATTPMATASDAAPSLSPAAPSGAGHGGDVPPAFKFALMAGGAVLVLATGLLWWRYGAGVFFDALVSAARLCF